MKKKGFSFEKHNEVGEELQPMRDYLTKLYCEIAKAYPVNSKVVRRANKASRALDELRSALDDCVCGEHPEKPDIEVVTVYYRRGRKE